MKKWVKKNWDLVLIVSFCSFCAFALAGWPCVCIFLAGLIVGWVSSN